MGQTNYKFLFAFVFLSFCGVLHSQNFLAFPDSNARWVNEKTEFGQYTGGSWLRSAPEYFVNHEDTLIGGQYHTKLFELHHNQVIYKGAYRQDSARLYLVPADDETEYLVYDFNAQVGDTLEDWYFLASRGMESWSQQGTFTVDAIDTIDTFLGSRRRLVTSMESFIEGIGCETGFLEGPCPCLSGWSYNLTCFSIGDSTYYDNRYISYSATAGNCEAYFDLAEEVKEEFEIYPNPSEGMLYFKTLEPGKLELFTIDGQKLWSGWLENEGQLDFSHLPKGLYWISLSGTSKKWIKR